MKTQAQARSALSLCPVFFLYLYRIAALPAVRDLRAGISLIQI